MPHASLMTRASLLLRLTEEPNDAAAWDEFVRIYGRHVVRWCRNYGLTEDDAQGLTWRQNSAWRSTRRMWPAKKCSG
jgi:hypothetical protein